MAERTCIIDGKLHRLETVRLPWWKRLMGADASRWVPVEPEFRG